MHIMTECKIGSQVTKGALARATQACLWCWAVTHETVIGEFGVEQILEKLDTATSLASDADHKAAC
jgi:hypothetical protein